MLTPSAKDKSRQSELERRRADPDSFGSQRLSKDSDQSAKQNSDRVKAQIEKSKR